ncbi:hypothetical protein ACQRBN_12995 [Bariatricus sp. SGI.154]|uniref:hypothetical protein n=1 Tax=Bariatricus sp. SGI.154 TaxID=3420549 RepID=UPI003D07671E
MAETMFVAGIAKPERMREEGIAESLYIIRTVSFSLGAELAFFLAGGSATYMEMGAARSIQAVTASRGN